MSENAKTWNFAEQYVHHNNPNCVTGKILNDPPVTAIERVRLQQGTGNKPLCSECKRLNKQRFMGIASTSQNLLFKEKQA